MIPFFMLVVVFAICRILGLAGVFFFSEWQHGLRVALAAMFLLTASDHWGKRRRDLLRMVPPALPKPEMWLTFTGTAEIAGASGLVWEPTAKAASAGLALMLVA